MGTYMMLIAGLVLLFVGGEALVRGSVSVARKLNISELVIGLTLVGFGTSVPELVTSLRAVDQDAVGLAVGNVIGSNVANVLMVLGVAALIRPILTNPKALARDATFMVAVTLLFCALIFFDLFSRPVGMVLVALLLAYMIFSIYADQNRDTEAGHMHEEEGESVDANYGLLMGGLLSLAGLFGVIIGAQWLVESGIVLARDFGISEAVIGLSIVAIGTSLPELATSAVAALRGKSDVALGNILGSNIFNILGIMGVTAIVSPFSVRNFEANVDSSAGTDITGLAMQHPDTINITSMISWGNISALILSVFLLVLFAFTGKRLARWEGAVLLGGYFLYLGLLFEVISVPQIIPSFV